MSPTVDLLARVARALRITVRDLVPPDWPAKPKRGKRLHSLLGVGLLSSAVVATPQCEVRSCDGSELGVMNANVDRAVDIYSTDGLAVGIRQLSVGRARARLAPRRLGTAPRSGGSPAAREEAVNQALGQRTSSFLQPQQHAAAPIALILLQASPDGEDMKLEVDKGAAILWPADFPVNVRSPLLAKLAEPYRQGAVLRERGLT
jgi:hypothetical protein